MNMFNHRFNNQHVRILGYAAAAIWPIILVSLLVLILYYIEGNIETYSLNMWDEGYLWYGVQRTALSEVPIRDFEAYDPGRYYWSAAIALLLKNDGIYSIHLAVALFQIMGLAAGLWMIRRHIKSNILLLVIGVALLLWMVPYYKSFDHIASIALVVCSAYLLEKPTFRSYFLSGIILGLVAFIGRNHGLYGVVGLFGAILLNRYYRKGPSFKNAVLSVTCGCLIGYLPMIMMLTFVNGFAHVFWDSIKLYWEIKATNHPLPIPWPWTLSFQNLSYLGDIRLILISMLFTALPVFFIAGLFILVKRQSRMGDVNPLFAAGVLLTLPYTHYAFSRADAWHLSLGGVPMLIGTFVLFGNAANKTWLFRSVASGIFAFALLFVILPMHPICTIGQDWKWTQVRSDVLKMEEGESNRISLATTLVNRYVQDRENVLMTFDPFMYAVLGVKSPTWEIYPDVPRSKSFQAEEILRIQQARTSLVFLNLACLDSKKDTCYENSHQEIFKFIITNFKPLTITWRYTLVLIKPYQPVD